MKRVLLGWIGMEIQRYVFGHDVNLYFQAGWGNLFLGGKIFRVREFYDGDGFE